MPVKILRQMGINSYCALPLATTDRRVGALGFGSAQVSMFAEADLMLLERVAKLVGLAVENVMTRSALQYEKGRLDVLLEVSRDLLSNLDVSDVFSAIGEFVRRPYNRTFPFLRFTIRKSPRFACIR
jgi:formate hydrogenlyase transcriptional activator